MASWSSQVRMTFIIWRCIQRSDRDMICTGRLTEFVWSGNEPGIGIHYSQTVLRIQIPPLSRLLDAYDKEEYMEDPVGAPLA
jgi:hypothetical protein